MEKHKDLVWLVIFVIGLAVGLSIGSCLEGRRSAVIP